MGEIETKRSVEIMCEVQQKVSADETEFTYARKRGRGGKCAEHSARKSQTILITCDNYEHLCEGDCTRLSCKKAEEAVQVWKRAYTKKTVKVRMGIVTICSHAC